MTYRPGASLTTATTLGYADTADLGPTAGNGFRTRWPDDLAALQQQGLTDVRITLDWARLQPKPGTVDEHWVELFEQVLQAADAIGLRPWACLHDGSIPRWFDNDGGFDDGENFTTWWPRWVERAAERLGDLVGGWIPFACLPEGAPDQPWVDTWGILAGGPPVVASIGGDDIGPLGGRFDLAGVALAADWTTDAVVGERQLAAASDRWGTRLREIADAAGTGLVVPGFTAGHDDGDTAGEIVATLRSVLDEATDDGVPIDVAFVEPGIAGPDSPPSLLDQDRAPTASCVAFLGT
jgi:beta-glucosidase